MEIKFENKMLGTYREVSHQLKRVQESSDSVVPDTNDDIGKIASVHTSVLLKSKDVSGRGVKVTGEACAVLLYITEGEDKISALNIKKDFEIEYEIGDMDAETLSQINLRINNAEARILNPRKVSVTFEIMGELSCFRPETVSIETELPQEHRKAVHTKCDSTEVMLASNVSEKSFALNEQYAFPSEKPAPRELLFQNPEFSIDDAQHIGSKIIIKGSLSIECCYLSDDVNYPIRTRFNSAFSQIIDSGEEDMDTFTAVIQMSSAYYELIDTINGEKALDAELHAVLQFVARNKQKISYIADAYSNSMPAVCKMRSVQLNEAAPIQKRIIDKDTEVNIADDCEDVLAVFAAISQAGANKGKITALINLDIVYRTKDSKLSSARRIINIEDDSLSVSTRILDGRISELDVKPNGENLMCKTQLEFTYQSYEQREICCVDELELQDDKAYDISRFPGLCMVRRDNESIWELAKRYHSSVESIELMNPDGENADLGLLLIPKEI